ncbi:hypothetical protein COT63_01815 [Candidatus Shapirobacteria bacterium CG09_land_8_20_14_0_10_38_17]|uniref:Glycosyltransferase RgtA/B/C/D-like domain-containing protein n=1 Tax=Candidatus Shapirobacteria bacterium CG09_land_8_20_14_0_10_38_17 TaxID=1974884 RepID=A0A2H0WR18_9BACT|nr:MAG: hypothetical protein COT63_01815 [Candidatus Shapirobacteria bacterium CG09_land_8_20_14_0_10_38_17]
MVNQFNASLWGDEAFAAVLAQHLPLEIIAKVAKDTSPPLYYLFLHFWMRLFGTSEIAIRALSFSFFLLTCFFIYLIGKKLFGQKTGILAAALSLVNPFLFHYAFEGRMYALLVLACTASIYFYLKKSWFWYIVATLAALYTHHFALLVIAVQGIWFLISVFQKKKRFFSNSFWAFLIVGLFYLPWLPALYYQTTLVESGFWLAKPNLKSLIDLFLSFTIGGEAKTLKLKIILGLLLLFLGLRQWKEKKRATQYLLIWYLVPIILTFVVSFLGQSIFFDRYLLLVIPSLTLLLASNLRKVKKTPFGLSILTVIIFLLGTNAFAYFIHPNKKPFAYLAFYIKQNKTEETGLINYCGNAHHLFESKYYHLQAPIYVPDGNLPFFVGTALMVREDVISELPNRDLIWVITSDNKEDVDLTNYQYCGGQEFDGLKVLWFKRNSGKT